MRFASDTQTIPKDVHSHGVKVIAAGQWRCATSSLQLAFEQILGLGPSMHGAYAMPNITTMKQLDKVTGEKDKQKRQTMLREVFDGYNASSDWPGMAFLDDLLDMYPDAKIVLNKRNTSEEWVKSVRSSLAFFSTWRYLLVTYWIPMCYWHHRMYTEYARLAKRRYGVDNIFTADCYERHNDWVRSVVAARGKDLLEWEPDDGWKPLCKFLRCEVPNEIFPRTNETAEIERLKVVLVKRGVVVWITLLSIVTCAIIGLVFMYKRFV